MERAETITVLANLGYTEKIANQLADDFTCLSSELVPLWERFCKDNNDKPDYVVGDYSIGEIMDSKGCNYVAAILTLDWLLKEPKMAKVALEQGVQ